MRSQPAWSAACTAALLVASLSSLAAQQQATVAVSDEWFYDRPDGKRIARLERGATMRAGRVEGEWQEVMLEGWIFTPSLGRATQPGFDLRVSKRPEENLRTLPNQRILARLATGFLLERLGGDANWTQVRRTGWVRRSALFVSGSLESSGANGREATPPGLGVSQTRVLTRILARPQGDTTAMVPESVTVRILERRGEWSRVRIEGWVENEKLVQGGGVLTDVSVRDLHDDPDSFRGRLIRWPLQYIALQTADELRPEIPEGRRYMLTRGPLPEPGFVYVVVPPDWVQEIEALVPLTTIIVVGRVRAARARYLNNPILDLVALETDADR